MIMSCNATFIVGIEFLGEIRVIPLWQVILDCNVTFMVGVEFVGEICVMSLSQVILDCANTNTFIWLLYYLSSLCSEYTELEIATH